MTKIYYSIDIHRKGYPVCWTDQAGNEHNEKLELMNPDPSDVDREFRLLHPGAIPLSKTQMDTRLARIEMEREQLKHWNGGAK